MPCIGEENSYRSCSSSIEYVPVFNDHIFRNIELTEKGNKIKSTNMNKIKKLEAMLCAILNELELDSIIDNIIIRAEKNGMVNISEFWKNHKKYDINRLSADLEKYSDHELALIKKILNRDKK